MNNNTCKQQSCYELTAAIVEKLKYGRKLSRCGNMARLTLTQCKNYELNELFITLPNEKALV